jgi:hypothetical protein
MALKRAKKILINTLVFEELENANTELIPSTASTLKDWRGFMKT